MGFGIDICSLQKVFFLSYVHLADSSLYASLSKHMVFLHCHLAKFEPLNCDFNVLSGGYTRTSGAFFFLADIFATFISPVGYYLLTPTSFI